MNEGGPGLQRAVGRVFSVECRGEQFRFYFRAQEEDIGGFLSRRTACSGSYFLKMFFSSCLQS